MPVARSHKMFVVLGLAGIAAAASLRPAAHWLRTGGSFDVQPGGTAGSGAPSRADCGTLTHPAARAKCVAVDTVEKVSGLPSRVERIAPSPRGYCIITIPTVPVLDGMGAVEVDTGGVVRALELADSAACPLTPESRAAGVRTSR